MENINGLGAAIEEYQQRTENARKAREEANIAGYDLVEKIAPNLIGVMTPHEACTIARRMMRRRQR